MYLKHTSFYRHILFASTFLKVARALVFAITAVALGFGLSTPSAAQSGYSVSVSASPSRGDAPLSVSFNIRISTERGADIAKVELNPGDGSGTIVAHTGRGWVRRTPKHVYSGPGRYTATATLTMSNGGSIQSRTRVVVLPDKPADPAELLQASPRRGDAPHTVTFQIGGESLPFTANAMRLSFGDGASRLVIPFETYTHTYQNEGKYLAKLDVRGNNGNRARSARLITVDTQPRLKFTVAPAIGVAPVEVTVRATIPRGDISRAGVLMDGSEIIGTSELVGVEGRRKLTITEPGTYRFELRAITENGKTLHEVRTVEITEESLSEEGSESFYEHDGGVVQIVQSGGAFQGTLRAPSLAQVTAGYDIGEMIARGAVADRAYSFSVPDNPDDLNSGRHRQYAEEARQIASGSYLVKSPNCKDQWGDYAFSVDYGSDERPASISGNVTFKGYMTRAEKAHKDAKQPMPRAGIIGRIMWVRDMIAMMKSQGDTSGKPDECVTANAQDESRPASFRRITAEEARKLAIENIEDVRDFAEHFYDGVDPDPPDDDTLRVHDPKYGDPPSSEDPVFLASGEFYETTVDLKASSPLGLAWRLQRTYRSQSPVHTSMGHGWVHNYQLALVQDGDGWRLRGENGGHQQFEQRVDGLFIAGDGSRLLVTDDARVIRTSDGMIYTFRPTPGRFEQSQLQTISLTEHVILGFSYDLLGRLTRVADQYGLAAIYEYGDARGYLTKVTAPDGSAVSFAYDGAGNLVSKADIDPDTGTPTLRTQYAYRGGGEDVDPALRHNLVAIWLTDSIGGQPTLDITYNEETGAHSFDRVVHQRTGNLIEQFEYSHADTNSGLQFTITLRADDRAEETHVFDAAGQIGSTTYLDANAQNIRTVFLYDDLGAPAGTVNAGGDRLLTSAMSNPNVVLYEKRPTDGSGLESIYWAVESDPVFGHEKAVYGPFSGTAPTTYDDLLANRKVTRVFDYEEAGIGSFDTLTKFSFDGSTAALGDVNNDGITSQYAGRIIQQSAYGDQTGTPEITRFVWNDDGTIQNILKPDESVQNFNYDASGRLLNVTETPYGGVSVDMAKYDWDEHGSLIGHRIGAEPYVGIIRDTKHRISEIHRADSPVRSFTYNTSNQIITEHVGENQVAAYTYDSFGKLLSRRLWPAAGDPIVESYEYDNFGNAIRAEDPAGVWSQELDELGRAVLELLPDGTERFYDYNVAGNLTSESGDGWKHTYTYDGFGRLESATTADGFVTRFSYDANGRAVGQTVTSGGQVVLSTTLDYSPENDVQVLSQGQDGSQYAAPNIDRGVGLVSYLNPVDAQLDWLGRITEFTVEDGSIWEMNWDNASRLTSARREGNDVILNAYDEHGNLASASQYGFASVPYSSGGRTVSRDLGNALITDSYDPYGRLTKSEAVNSVLRLNEIRQFEYDAVGRVVRHSSGYAEWSRQFDGIAPTEDRLQLGSGEIYSIQRQYGEQGRLTRRVLPSGTVLDFAYPESSRSRISVAGSEIAIQYTSDGAISSIELGKATVGYAHPIPNGQETAFHVWTDGADGNLLDRSVNISNGRVTSISERSFGEPMELNHDASGRLIEATYPWLDGGGATTRQFSTGPFTVTGDVANSGDASPLGYIDQIDGTKINRNLFGQVIGAEIETGSISYERDAQGRVVSRRMSGETLHFVYDSASLTSVILDGTPVIEYILDRTGVTIGRIVNGRVELVALDIAGGPLAYMSETGTLSERVFITPYGTPKIAGDRIDSLRVKPLLAGMLYDVDAGLYLTATRAMSPSNGAFLSPDPIGPFASPDPYAYALNDPYTFRDVTGKAPDSNTSNDGEERRGPTEFVKDTLNTWVDNADEGISGNRESRPETDEGNQGRSSGGQSSSGGTLDTPIYVTPNTAPRERTEEDELRDERRAKIAEATARRRAEDAAFKRNVRFAREILPEEVIDQWLEEDDVFKHSFEWIDTESPIPWGNPVTGPTAGNAGDPHGLLRNVFSGEEGSNSERLKFLFRDQLAVPPPVTPPAGQGGSTPRLPGQLPDNSSSLEGGASMPPTSPPTATPTAPRPPGGLSGRL